MSDSEKNQRICLDFVKAINDYFPDIHKKVKIHLLLHLTQSMIDFGPTSAFNTERYVHMCMLCIFMYNSIPDVKRIMHS